MDVTLQDGFLDRLRGMWVLDLSRPGQGRGQVGVGLRRVG